jgi:hypothetical protein
MPGKKIILAIPESASCQMADGQLSSECRQKRDAPCLPMMRA